MQQCAAFLVQLRLTSGKAYDGHVGTLNVTYGLYNLTNRTDASRMACDTASALHGIMRTLTREVVLEVEEYNEYGEIKPVIKKEIIPNHRLNAYQQHRIHETKDLFESSCFYCQKAMDNNIKSYWKDGD